MGWCGVIGTTHYLGVVFGAVVVEPFRELLDDHRQVPAQPQSTCEMVWHNGVWYMWCGAVGGEVRRVT